MRIPECVSISMVPFDRAYSYDWHTHDYDELAVVLDSVCEVGHDGERVQADNGSAFWATPEERHGCWNVGGKPLRLLVFNFRCHDAMPDWIAEMRERAPEDRVWQLETDLLRNYARLFFQGLLWRFTGNPTAQTLLDTLSVHLTSVLYQKSSSLASSATADWREEDHAVMDWIERRLSRGHLESANEAFPNYDSMRHGFTKRHGISPAQLMQKMRLERAQFMLLQTSLTIREISERLGYQRQHEFSRAFSRAFGVSPQQWRVSPR